MALTPASLLDRLKIPQPVPADWQRLHDIYVPLLRTSLSRLGIPDSETDDLSQEIWLVVLRLLPTFERLRDGSFRTWLRQIAVNQVRNWRRQKRHLPYEVGEAAISQLEDPNSPLTAQFDLDHDRHVFEKLLAVIQPDFAPVTWDVFRRFAIDGIPAAQVARDFSTTEAAVLQAKSRILRRLRVEAAGLIE